MATLPVYNQNGEAAGSLEVRDSLVGVEINLHVIRQCVDAYLAAQRQGTAKTKEKGEVRGGGIKPWKQKGTGRARAGSRRSPLWRGGGTMFGPVPRSYRRKVNRKARQLAMCSVLTDRVAAERLKVIESLSIADGRLKTLASALRGFNLVGRTLIVTAQVEPMVTQACANRTDVDVQVAGSLSVYQLLNHDNLLVTKAAMEKMEEMWG